MKKTYFLEIVSSVILALGVFNSSASYSSARVTGGIIGGVIGAGVGTGIGFALESTTNDYGGGSAYVIIPVSAAVGLLIGAVTGVLIAGSLKSSAEANELPASNLLTNVDQIRLGAVEKNVLPKSLHVNVIEISF